MAANWQERERLLARWDQPLNLASLQRNIYTFPQADKRIQTVTSHQLGRYLIEGPTRQTTFGIQIGYNENVELLPDEAAETGKTHVDKIQFMQPMMNGLDTTEPDTSFAIDSLDAWQENALNPRGIALWVQNGYLLLGSITDVDPSIHRVSWVYQQLDHLISIMPFVTDTIIRAFNPAPHRTVRY